MITEEATNDLRHRPNRISPIRLYTLPHLHHLAPQQWALLGIPRLRINLLQKRRERRLASSCPWFHPDHSLSR